MPVTIVDGRRFENYCSNVRAECRHPAQCNRTGKCYQRQLNGALNNMKERRILAAVRGEDDRYEITPVIRYVVNAAFLEHMLTEYTKLAERAGSETRDE